MKRSTMDPSAPERPYGIRLAPYGYVALMLFPLAVLGYVLFWAHYGPYLFGDGEHYAAALPGLIGTPPIYDPAKLVPHLQVRPPFFDQTPATALVSVVFLLPNGLTIWGLLMVGCLALGLIVVWPNIGIGGTLLLSVALLAWLPLQSAITWANLNSLIFLLFAAAWRFPRISGYALGVTIALKLVPILMLAWLLAARRWRDAAVAVIVAAALTLVVVVIDGPRVITDFLVMRMTQTTVPGMARWGLMDLGLPLAAAYLVAIILAVQAFRSKSFTLSLLSVMATIPALHEHYIVWLLVPILGMYGEWLPRISNIARWWARPASPAHS